MKFGRIVLLQITIIIIVIIRPIIIIIISIVHSEWRMTIMGTIG